MSGRLGNNSPFPHRLPFPGPPPARSHPHPRIAPSVAAAAAASPGRPERRRRRRGGDAEVSWPGPMLRAATGAVQNALAGPRPHLACPSAHPGPPRPLGIRLTCSPAGAVEVAWQFRPEPSVMGTVTLMTALWRPPSPSRRAAPSPARAGRGASLWALGSVLLHARGLELRGSEDKEDKEAESSTSLPHPCRRCPPGLWRPTPHQGEGIAALGAVEEKGRGVPQPW